MSSLSLVGLHLATVVPAGLIGAGLLLQRKGTRLHRRLGILYSILMLLTAGITLLMPAQVGPQWLEHFGWIHGFSLLVLFSVPLAVLAARRGDLAAHRAGMRGVYFGGIVIAGSFTLMPGRLLHGWLFGA